MLRLGLLGALAALAFGSACRGTGNSALGDRRQLALTDTLPSLIAGLRGALPGGPAQAFRAYEREHAALLEAGGAHGERWGDDALLPLTSEPEATLARLERFEAVAPAELEALVGELSARLGGAPRMMVVLAALPAQGATFSGRGADGPVLVVNALAPALADPTALRLTLARELCAQLHRERAPDQRSLGPLARRLFRDGATLLALRQLSPRFSEEQLFGLDAAARARLEGRAALLAKELLASIDSGSEAEATRFFGDGGRDPLVPPGAGAFLADRLFARLAAEMGSASRPLSLAPAELMLRARKHLSQLADGRR